MSKEKVSSNDRNEIAAVDLGSNSFHMIIGIDNDHGISVIDRVREMVRLGADMDQRQRISSDAEHRALTCLANFRERLMGFDDDQVVVVGTNTLRKASNARGFIRRAEETLGFPINVISGIEEARLIYTGVNYALQEDRGRRMVVDIGGGSTEIIVGDGKELLDLKSMEMGCVSFTQRFMPKGKIDKKKMKRAILAAEVKLEPHIRKLREFGIADAIGSSGTARAIEQVVVAQDWSTAGITRASLLKLRDAVIAAGNVNNLALEGLSAERTPVFPGGVAILYAIFEVLGLEEMRISSGALREGALLELSGRRHRLDRRSQTVNELIRRYHIDPMQSSQVTSTARKLFKFVAADWSLKKRQRKLLSWAAQLHEIGLSLTHSQHHKHGAYILKHMELAGFSRQDQDMISTLVRLQRKKFDLQLLAETTKSHRTPLTRVAILLRLAVVLNRGRLSEEIPVISLKANERSIILLLPESWEDERPLTMADLEKEARELRKGGYLLTVMTEKADSGGRLGLSSG